MSQSTIGASKKIFFIPPEKTTPPVMLLPYTCIISEFQRLPIVRYWIPHIRIISPEGLQAEMEKDIRGYLERVVG